MRRRYRLSLVSVAALVVLAGLVTPAVTASGATVPGPAAAVAYQIGIGHDGYSGDTTIVPPLSRRWSRTFAGPVSYPLIADGMVFVTVADNGGSYGTNLYALDQATGAILWSQPISGTYFWSNAAYDSGRIYVVNFDGLLRAFDAASGALDWSSQLLGPVTSPPTADSGVVYEGGGGEVDAVSESTGSVVWTQPVESGDHSSPALSSTSMYVSYACGQVNAFDRVTGQQQWFTSGSCTGGGGKTPVYHSGQVYARDFTGNKILDASTGALLGTFQAGPVPAFDGQIGLFLNAGTLQAVNGGTLWTFTGDGGLDTAPVAVGSTVYEGSSSGMLYGLDVTTGQVVWSTNVGSGIGGPDEQDVSSPLTGLGAGQGLLVVPAGGQLTAYATAGAVPTTTSLTASPDPATAGQAVTLTATETAADGTRPAGSVQFQAGTTAIGSPVAVDATGTASTTATFAAAGTQVLSAVFTPAATTTYGVSSGTYTEIVQAAGASSGSEPVTLAVPATGAFTFTVGTGTVTLAVSGPDAIGVLNPITVSDARNTYPGWSVSGQASGFTGSGTAAGSTIPGNQLGWMPTGTLSDAVLGPAVAPASPGLGATAAILAFAAAGHGFGTSTLGADLTLAIPALAAAGPYASTLTVTAVTSYL